jgi:hypothetical protein
VEEVTPGEATGLLSQAVDPFEAGALHPGGCPSHIAGHEAHADADAHEPGPGQAAAEVLDDVLLLGRAKGDVDDIGIGLAQ